MEIHDQNIQVTFKFQGHGVNVKAMAANKRLHVGLCALGTQLDSDYFKVNTSAIECLKRLVSEMTRHVPSRT